jgi:hypothetical protein
MPDKVFCRLKHNTFGLHPNQSTRDVHLKDFMPALRNFIKRIGLLEESICSKCCQIVKPGIDGSTLQAEQMKHRCGEFSLNTITRGVSSPDRATYSKRAELGLAGELVLL